MTPIYIHIFIDIYIYTSIYIYIFILNYPNNTGLSNNQIILLLYAYCSSRIFLTVAVCINWLIEIVKIYYTVGLGNHQSPLYCK